MHVLRRTPRPLVVLIVVLVAAALWFAFGRGGSATGDSSACDSSTPVGTDRESQLAASPVVKMMALGLGYDEAVEQFGDMAPYPSRAEAERLKARVTVRYAGHGVRCTV